MNTHTRLLSLGVGLFFLAQPVFAQGEVDYSFRAPAADEPIFAVASDGFTNVWIGGAFSTVGSVSCPSLAYLNSDGSLDPRMQVNFTSTVGQGLSYVVSIGVDNDNGVYAGFNTLSSSGGGVARWTYVPQNPFAYDHHFTTNVSALVISVTSLSVDSSDSRVYVTGRFRGAAAGAPLAAFDAVSGDLIAAVGAGFSNSLQVLSAGTPYLYQVRCLRNAAPGPGAVAPSEIVAGSFGVAELDENGHILTLFAQPPRLSGGFTCAAKREGDYPCLDDNPYGEFLAGGASEPLYIQYAGFEDAGSGGMELVRLGAQFPLQPTNFFPYIAENLNYPADSGANIARILALPAGDMLVGGQFDSIRGESVQNFAHLFADGAVDVAFPNKSRLSVLDMGWQPDGKCLLAGYGAGFDGYVERRNAVPAPSDPTFTPDLADQSVYAGDSTSFSTKVGGWPAPLVGWLKDGGPFNGRTGYYDGVSQLYLDNVAESDAGEYRLRATNSLCSSVSSGAAHLTVLAAPPAPANDLFTNAVVLSGLAVNARGTIRSATEEPGEPKLPAGYDSGRSVWWTWTAPFTGLATLDSSGSDFAATIGVFHGAAVDALQVVTNNYDYPVRQGGDLLSSLTFPVTAGSTYQIAVGGVPNAGSLGNVLFTLLPGGAAWSVANSGSGASLYGVVCSPDAAVACGAGGTLLVGSAAGGAWGSAVSGTTSTLRGAAYGPPGFVVVGDGGVILLSTDGLGWAAQTSGVSATLWGVAFGGGKYVAVGDNDLVLTSTNGSAWVQGATGQGLSPGGIAYVGGRFIASGQGGMILLSADGVSWAPASIPVYDNLYAPAYGNGGFVAVGFYGTVIVSGDGASWRQSAFGQPLLAVTFADGRFAAVGFQGRIALSSDGTNWVSDVSGENQTLHAIAPLGTDRFIAVGDAGTIVVSQPPRIGPLLRQANGPFQFAVTGLSGSTAVAEAAGTLDPPDWQPIGTNTIVNGSAAFSDTAQAAGRFYRVRLR